MYYCCYTNQQTIWMCLRSNGLEQQLQQFSWSLISFITHDRFVSWKAGQSYYWVDRGNLISISAAAFMRFLAFQMKKMLKEEERLQMHLFDSAYRRRSVDSVKVSKLVVTRKRRSNSCLEALSRLKRSERIGLQGNAKWDETKINPQLVADSPKWATLWWTKSFGQAYATGCFLVVVAILDWLVRNGLW